MERSIGRAAKLLPFPAPARTYNFTTAVIGQTEAAVNSAVTLAEAGLEVLMFGTAKHPLEMVPGHQNIFGFEGSAATSVSGTLGNFQVTAQLRDGERSFTVGGVIIGEKSRNIALYRQNHNLPAQVVQAKGATNWVFLLCIRAPLQFQACFWPIPPACRSPSKLKELRPPLWQPPSCPGAHARTGAFRWSLGKPCAAAADDA
jgi:hypothetical protein